MRALAREGTSKPSRDYSKQQECNLMAGVVAVVPVFVDALSRSAVVLPDRVPARLPRGPPRVTSADNSLSSLKGLALCGWHLCAGLVCPITAAQEGADFSPELVHVEAYEVRAVLFACMITCFSFEWMWV